MKSLTIKTVTHKLLPSLFVVMSIFCSFSLAEEIPLQDTAEPGTQARFVDFEGELGVSSASLENLGERIDEARNTSNPIELATLSVLLAAVEKTSQKKAKLDSAALRKESAAIAELRREPTEMRTVAKLIGGEESTELDSLAESIEEEASEEGATEKAINGTLRVVNKYCKKINVFVNGYLVGWVGPHSHYTFSVNNAHCLTAATDCRCTTWGPRNIHDCTCSYVWTLNP